MYRRAFTLLEVLIVVAIMASLAGISVPLYRRYQIRSDLDIAAQQMVQAVGRAQVLSQAGQDGSSWGVWFGSGVLYKGSSYATRDIGMDENYPYPETIRTSGLPEVSFSRIEGRPSATGSVLLRAITGEQRSISITISSEGIATNEADSLTVCHQLGGSCSNKSINDNAWNGHKVHGDYLGTCRDKDGDGDTCDDD